MSERTTRLACPTLPSQGLVCDYTDSLLGCQRNFHRITFARLCRRCIKFHMHANPKKAIMSPPVTKTHCLLSKLSAWNDDFEVQ